MDVNALVQNASATLITVINTRANVRTIVGNNEIFSDKIQNYSANPYRRVDLTAMISNSVGHRDAIRLIEQRRAMIPSVLPSPAPDVDVLQFTPPGPLLCVARIAATTTIGRCTSTRTG